MTKSIPNYLRLHRGPKRPRSQAPADSADNVDQFWDAYREATGWRIDSGQPNRPASMTLLPAVNVDLMDGVDTEPAPAVSHSHAVRLAESATEIAQQLKQAREALRRQEAELACRASLLVGDETRDRLANQVENVLADAATACGCQAAALYTLDDDTAYLKARSVHGLGEDVLANPPRELRGSRGDLEALVQDVVLIDNLHAGSIDTWNCPEDFNAAICAAIKQDGVPIGTLWLFADSPQSFGEAHAATMRMACNHVALLLASATLKSEDPKLHNESAVIRDVAQWQYESLPVGAVLAEGWRVDGMIESPRPFVSGWHAWDVLPDGSLLLAMAEAADTTANGAFSATIARAALTAHTGYRHTPRQLMQRIHDTLWNTSTGQQLVSMLYARIDPESGEGEVASAGNLTALISNQYGYRPLVDGLSDPLTSHIDSRCSVETFKLAEGEVLLAYNQGIVKDGASQWTLGESMQESMLAGDRNPLANLRRQMAPAPLDSERGLVTLLRLP